MPEVRAPAVLVVEDSDEDFETIYRIMQKAGVPNPLLRCSDGEAALDYFERLCNHTLPGEAPKPALVLLDLNLPGTDGREVLQTIKADPRLRPLPIVVLTTSSNPRDVHSCYTWGANGYLTKPVNLPKFVETLDCFVQYWLKTSSLPAFEVR